MAHDSLNDLFNTLSRKNKEYGGSRVADGWLKYEFGGTYWNLNDESDYQIFIWRSRASGAENEGTPSSVVPTLHLHDPAAPLPTSPPAHLNPSYYLHHPSRVSVASPSPNAGTKPRKAKSLGGKSRHTTKGPAVDDVPAFKKQFDQFHGENGVRTVLGSIGPVQNVRMLLKSGFRHVYISRKFAIEHGFIPEDASLGHYGYGGLINIGSWNIALTPSTTQPDPQQDHLRPTPMLQSDLSSSYTPSTYNESADNRSSAQQYAAQAQSHIRGSPSTFHGAGSHLQTLQPPAAPKANSTKPKKKSKGPHSVLIPVYLSEEPHFDVVLGRSFFEKRQIRISQLDPTDVIAGDTGEKIECELVVLKDGKGEIVIGL